MGIVRYGFNSSEEVRRPAWRWRKGVGCCVEKSLPDQWRPRPALNQERGRQRIVGCCATVSGLQAKRAMRGRCGGPGQRSGIVCRSGSISDHPAGAFAGTNFNPLRHLPRDKHQRVGERRRKSPQQHHEHGQPHRPGAAQRCAVQGEGHRDVRSYILCLLWSMAGMSAGLAPGAAIATGTVSSVRVSTPLASLKVRVMAILESFCSGAFRSISMTW